MYDHDVKTGEWSDAIKVRLVQLIQAIEESPEGDDYYPPCCA
jgi:hypothetical protein